MRKRMLSIWLCLMMVMSVLPTVSFAAKSDTAPEGGAKIYVDAVKGDDTTGNGTDTTPYKTVEKAVTAAASGATIQLGAGNYTLYGVSSVGHTKGKALTFVGRGADKTGWNIGAEVPDPANFGTEYNGDYSFDGAGTITFRNMTLRSGSADYLGFIRADKTVVEDCIINGKTFYWGYTSATFKNTTFNCPSGDYALWTYSSPTMTFNNCTFNSSGKVINVYTDAGAGKQDITVNFKDCKVTNTGLSFSSKQVLNVNDSNMGDFKYVLNISGNNTVSNVPYDDTTCSRLYGFGRKATTNNTGKLDVNIDDTLVWSKGEMLTHKYSAGQQDNAFTTVEGDWITKPDGTQIRTVTKTCNYCGYKEETKEFGLDISRSKTATALNTRDWTSDVTLSLPSAEEKLASDVVFVLDKSTSTDLEDQALGMLNKLKEQAESTEAQVKVGVVIFNKQANETPLTDLAIGYETIENAIKQEIKSGTNTHAGLLAGKQMLDEDTEVAANRKYLIFVSDGITYMYNAEPTATAWSFKADSWNHWVGPDNWNSKYGNDNPPADWSAWMNEIGKKVEAQGTKYEYPYGGEATNCTPEEDTYKDYANSIDKALYLTYQVYQEAQEAGYNCYAVANEVERNYLWARPLCATWLMERRLTSTRSRTTSSTPSAPVLPLPIPSERSLRSVV